MRVIAVIADQEVIRKIPSQTMMNLTRQFSRRKKAARLISDVPIYHRKFAS
jgi:uncharacterized FlaG/YvyC family protein